MTDFEILLSALEEAGYPHLVARVKFLIEQRDRQNSLSTLKRIREHEEAAS